MRRLYRGLLIASTLLVLIGGQICAFAADARVVYSRDGNALILYGGPKDHGVPLSALRQSFRENVPDTDRAWYVTISDYDSTSYGNGFVRTEFSSTVEYGGDLIKVWREVDGESRTFWGGTVPQYNSSQIQLDESWIFSGICVSVSFPGGVGFAGGGRTVTWSGRDSSGTNWSMGHIYSGIYAQSYVFMNNVTQTSMGSHYFQSSGMWVTTAARASS